LGAGRAQALETIKLRRYPPNAIGCHQWTLNGETFSMDTMKPVYTVHQGRRYRLKFRNASDDIHPLYPHRHNFELTRIGGKPAVGVIKDVIMVGGFHDLEFDFVADNPGLTLFHYHQQLHMDFGFMALFNYAQAIGTTWTMKKKPAR
jgi:FtsP/CotA-like multicopper oxidase with cupredoxin domain